MEDTFCDRRRDRKKKSLVLVLVLVVVAVVIVLVLILRLCICSAQTDGAVGVRIWQVCGIPRFIQYRAKIYKHQKDVMWGCSGRVIVCFAPRQAPQ